MTTKNLLEYELTATILKCCYEVIDELGWGFLESIYKIAICLSLQDAQILVELEKPFEVFFKERKVGHYKADIVANGKVLIEVKSCKNILPEHQAQVINYLKASNISTGLLINFGNQNLEYKRLYHPNSFN